MRKFHRGELRAQYYDFPMGPEERANFVSSLATGHLKDKVSIESVVETKNQRFILFISFVISCILTSIDTQL
jgi:hypothetical protein